MSAIYVNVLSDTCSLKATLPSRTVQVLMVVEFSNQRFLRAERTDCRDALQRRVQVRENRAASCGQHIHCRLFSTTQKSHRMLKLLVCLSHISKICLYVFCVLFSYSCDVKHSFNAEVTSINTSYLSLRNRVSQAIYSKL